jgi:apolipoprotein N-acyltransferase
LARPVLALGAGLLVAASLPPWGVWPLALAGVATLELALGPNPSPRQAMLLGWLFGVGWLAPALGWMWFLTAPGYVVAVNLFALLHGLAELGAPRGRWRVIGRPAAHTLAEVVRMAVPFGGVPLATLGISQVAGPLAAGARIGGVVLLTWLTFQAGFALAHLPRLARRERAGAHSAAPGATEPGWWLAGGAVGAVVGVVLVAATVAPSGDGTGTTWRVAAVQGGGPQGTRAIDTDARVVFERHLAATRSIEPDPELDLVLWPENVIDIDGLDGGFATSDELAEVAAEAARLGVPLSVGITEDVDADHFTNAQVVVTPDGEIASRYDKVRRVPFGEYVPLRGLLETLGAPVDQVPRDALAGTDPAVLDVAGEPVSVAISWEVFFGGRVREGVELGGRLVINPTNGSSYTGTILQSQQVASSRLRAIETGRWVVQASPTGFSAFVSPSGEVLDRTGVSERAVIVRDVELRRGSTWYVSLGDRVFILLVGATLAGAWWMALRSRRWLDVDGGFDDAAGGAEPLGHPAPASR